MEIETFDVELVKDSRGLGITIAGYVGEKTSGVRTFITILNLASKQTPVFAYIKLNYCVSTLRVIPYIKIA